MQDRILIIDFGSQVTQLIARRIREAGVYSEIVPFQSAEKALDWPGLKGIILSGGPASVHEGGSPRAPDRVFTRGVPVLGICYGEQTMCAQLGGKVEPSDHREFGKAFVEVRQPNALFDGVWEKGERHQVWMSHGDRVTAIPEGFKAVATSEGAPFAAIADEHRQFYATQFHMEVVHTPDGARLLAQFRPRDLRLQGRLVDGAFQVRDGRTRSRSRWASSGSSAASRAGSIPPSPPSSSMRRSASSSPASSSTMA